MFAQQIILVTASLFVCTLAQNELDFFETRKQHPDVGLRVPELVAKYGYPIETHVISTEDNYVVTLHRIPHGKNNVNETNKPVIFLMHGLLCSSADWVLMGPEQGLGYLLADLGYDVWMGNARGNTYSRRHAYLNPDRDHSYWKFSWHEIGIYDLPAMIDYALAMTQQDKLYYIGHSQGTTTFFVMTAMMPEYNDKIRVMVALGPAAYFANMPNIALKITAKFYRTIGWVSKMFGQYEFLPSTKFMQMLGQKLCNEESKLQGICNNILFLISGFDDEQLNKTMLPVIISNSPAGISTFQFLHYSQEINSKKFAQYDYGFIKNLIKYGKRNPPEYDLTKVSAPVALFYGNNDLLISPKDVSKLHEELPHSILKYKIKYNKFTHLDFLWAKDVVGLVYNKIFDILKRF